LGSQRVPSERVRPSLRCGRPIGKSRVSLGVGGGEKCALAVAEGRRMWGGREPGCDRRRFGRSAGAPWEFGRR
jgi:hypothetical protein